MMNAIIIGLETDFPDKFSWDIVENIFLVLFTMELEPLICTALVASFDGSLTSRMGLQTCFMSLQHGEKQAIRIYCLGVYKFFNCRNNPDIAWNLFDFMLVSMGVPRYASAAAHMSSRIFCVRK